MRGATLAILLAALAGTASAQAGELSDPVPAAAPPLIDPDCHPVWAETADPALLEEPDEVCPPGSPEPPSEGAPNDGAGGSKPDGGDRPGPDAEPAPPASDPAPAAVSGSPLALPIGRGPATPVGRRPAPRPPRPAAPRPSRDREPKQEARRRRPAAEPDADRPRRRDTAGVRRTATPAPAPRFPLSALEGDRPDPIPPARRLDRRFARRLARVSERSRVSWELMLAVIRARGNTEKRPPTPRELRRLARRLVKLGARKHPRRAVRKLAERRPEGGRQHFVQRVVALAHYNRAVRLAGLVRGLKATRKQLARRVLDHHRLVIYEGGRQDIRSGFTDVRVLVLLLYLSSRTTEVTVTSLTSGHSFLTASGNVSLHSHGRAVDIAAIGGRPILGNQEPGGLTERTLRRILLLPKRLQPTELISLFDLGGPAFALADHADHVHVGY